MLAGIQSAGGIKALKKVDRTKVRDRSAAMVPGAENESGGGAAPSAPSGGGGGGMQDALAVALAKRKKKIVDSGKYKEMMEKARKWCELWLTMNR